MERLTPSMYHPLDEHQPYFKHPEFSKKRIFTHPIRTNSPVMTVIMGAKCSDGMVIVGDTRLSRDTGEYVGEIVKVKGDLGHHLLGFSGNSWTADVFRKYVVGDSVVEKQNPYSIDNLVIKLRENVRKFNCDLVPYDTGFAFRVLVGRHLFKEKEFELFAIERNGEARTGDFLAIGSGQETAERLFKEINCQKLTMADFTKRGYFAIKFMENYYPSLGVGVKNNDPYVSYMPYNEEWDILPSEQDMKEARDFAYQEIERIDKSVATPSYPTKVDTF